MATVAVLAATGGVGSKLVEELLEHGHTVRALARRPHAVAVTHDQLEVVYADVTEPDSLGAAVDGVDIVLSCLGNTRGKPPVTAAGTANLIAAMVAAKVERLAVISSAGVGSSKQQASRSLLDAVPMALFTKVVVPLFLRATFEDLERMEGIVADSPLSTVIVRPVGLTDGARTGSWVAGGPELPVKSTISRADVAAFMASLVEERSHDGSAVTVCGS